MTLSTVKPPAPAGEAIPFVAPQLPAAKEINLETLIAPMSVDEFLSTHWRKRIFHAQGTETLVQSIKAALGSFHVPTLVGRASAIDAMPRGGGRKERLSNISQEKALELYEQGYTLYFDLRHAVPELAQVGHNIAKQIGIVPAQTSCSIFASRKNSGVTTHFDNNENFTVQLRGKKNWIIWSNPDVRNPAHCFATGEPLIDAESGMYIHPSIRDTDFHDGETVAMVPGSVLYHHGGSWHTTRADDEESVSLNVFVRPIRFFNLLEGAIQARLFSHPAIRDDVPPQRNDHEREEFSRAMTAAIHAAAKVVAEIDPKDALLICALPNGFADELSNLAKSCPVKLKAKTALRKNSLVAFDHHADTTRVLLKVHAFLGVYSRQFVLEVPDELEEACLAATSCQGEFSARQLAGRSDDVDAYLEVCSALVAVGAFRIVSE